VLSTRRRAWTSGALALIPPARGCLRHAPDATFASWRA
jgi:hypothetical protein